MNDHSDWRANIPPPDAGPRPKWSVMIPAYGRPAYLEATLRSVLVQDPGPAEMQIEVVDDCSPEPLDDVVTAVGGGRVGYYRQPQNVGSTRNFATCLLQSRGVLVHILHGDDLVLPGFYSTLEQAFDARPEIGAAFCGYLPIDERGVASYPPEREQEHPGVLPHWLERLARGQRLQAPCIAVRRQVYERLGGFDERIRYGEDWEMWVRIAAHYPVWYEPEALACYRVHAESITGETHRSGADVDDLRHVIELNRPLLPPEQERAISRDARKEVAVTALRRGARAFARGDGGTARSQCRAALATAHSPSVLLHGAGYGTRALAWRISRALRRTRTQST